VSRAVLEDHVEHAEDDEQADDEDDEDDAANGSEHTRAPSVVTVRHTYAALPQRVPLVSGADA
jgi:hypothetical protein